MELAINQDNVVEEINVFILSMPMEYSLGHCVSKDMSMSAGIATYFKAIYGRVGELMDQKPNIGDVAYLQENDRFIYYLITKEYSYNKPTYQSLTAAIEKLRNYVVKHGVKKLAIPRIGCGLDKLDWAIVKDIIKHIFKDIGCMIKVCHFSQSMSKEKEMLKINHPTNIKIHQKIKDIEKREFEKLNFILYSRKTTSPVYWDEHFQSVNDKYCFKSQYYKDYESGLKVGQCLHYCTIEAHIYVIITNKNTDEHFSYKNLDVGLMTIKNMIYNNQWHPTFIIQSINNRVFENLINRKIVTLICSAFLELTPCVIFEVGK